MKFFRRKIWFFVIFLFFLLLAVFYFKAINAKFTEVLSQYKFFGASLTEVVEAPINEVVLPEFEEQSQQITEESIIPKQDEAKNMQEQLDDIAEKIDILKQEILKLVPPSSGPSESESQPDINKEPEIVEPAAPQSGASLAPSGRENTEDNKDIATADVAENEAPKVNPFTGGGKKSYFKILISEVEIAGLDDKKQEFVELYNPNLTDADLSGWYLQKKTKNGEDYSTFVSNKLFSGKNITANGYFLIARQDSSFFNLADIVVDNALTDSNSLILKNPNRDISDKVGWGDAQDFELLPAQNPNIGQNIGRKIVSEEEQDTDNNSSDFELQTPTPKAKNETWVEPPLPEEKDTIAPEVSFSIESVQNSLNFSVNFTITDPIGAVTPSGIDSYIFRQKEAEALPDGGWQEDISVKVSGSPSSADLTREFLGEDGKTYYFQVKAKDLTGNESDWLPIEPVFTKIEIIKPVEIKPILINEIQIIPIEQRFVELYNPNSIDIDLTDWYLQRKKQGDDSFRSFVSSTNFEGKIITANSYFLISRELENSDILLDIALKDDDSLSLKNKSREIIDKVGWGEASDFEGAPALNPEAGKSLERKILGEDTNDNSQDFIILDAPTPKL
ncbi:MAG: lamin tail domain-containing protein [Patescibacteria group bacterium]